MDPNIDKIKGKTKQVKGIVTGNDKLRAEGVVDEIKGKAKEAATAVAGAVEKAKVAVKTAAGKL
jgi:uncharacterized protein YjbJ (UPF0337 family)